MRREPELRGTSSVVSLLETGELSPDIVENEADPTSAQEVKVAKAKATQLAAAPKNTATTVASNASIASIASNASKVKQIQGKLHPITADERAAKGVAKALEEKELDAKNHAKNLEKEMLKLEREHKVE